MKTTALSALLFASLTLLVGTAQAATFTWDDATKDGAWTTASNWAGGVVPTANGDIIIGSMVSPDNTIGLNTNGDYTANSFTFGVGLPAVEIVPGGGQALDVVGSLTNSSLNEDTLALIVNAVGTTQTFNGGTGGLLFDQSLNVGTSDISTLGKLQMDTGTSLNFTISSTSVFGSISSINAAGALISIQGNNYVGKAGDTFDFTSGNFLGAQLDVADLPHLGAGLSWDTTDFLADGILSVQGVPEPSTYVMLLLGGLVLVGLRKRDAITARLAVIRK
jgi:PEP-CTERM motif